MGNKYVIVMFLVVFYLRISFAASLNKSNTDESSLLALKAHLSSDILAKNWSQETSFCSWIGVTCSRRHPRVTNLDLSNMGLRGTIAREIGNLSFLTFLDISNNSINGPIPAEIGNLRRLHLLVMALNQLSDHIPQNLGLLRIMKHLDLSNNYLSGDIPTSLSTCVQLRVLDISDNNLTGNIPKGFGNLSQLQYLYLESNQLTGELNGSTIFNVSSLVVINVGDNKMSGSIPEDVCSHPATNLEELWLASNQFEGEIPSTLTRCHSLKVLYLWNNKFTGNIPTGFWNLSAIQNVYLGRNGFTGTIPPSIANLSSSLVEFDISENNFDGNVPSEMGLLSNLTRLNLEVNTLNGEVPPSIFNLSRLQILSLAANDLIGNLPISIDKGLPSIKGFYLGINRFHGKVPLSISNLSKLTSIELSRNLFSGDIPLNLGNLRQLSFLNLGGNHFTNNLSDPKQDFLSSLSNCKYLKFIQLSINSITGVLPKSLGSSNLSTSLQLFLAHSCKFIGPIPNEIGNLSNLIWLALGSNDMTGHIPTTLGHLSKLQAFGIVGSKLNGSVSGVFCNLSNLYTIAIYETNFSGQLPWCLGNLPHLRTIKFSDNAFNSNIPSTLWFNEKVERIDFSNNFLDGHLSREIGNMKSMIELYLSGNQFSGEIPSTISKLQMLTTLSLSNNKLDGQITESLADLKGLLYLDLSRNNLSGPIPKSLETLSSLGFFNVSFNQLSGEIPNRGPFTNFTVESFRGNKGLCGAPRFKVEACKKSVPMPSNKNKLLIYILPAIALVIVVTLILIVDLRHRGRELQHLPLPDLPLGFMHERISYYEVLRSTNNLDEEHLIGRGSFGSVYKGKFSNAIVAAVKVFNLDVQGAFKSFDIECQVMRSIRHRNLVKVIASCSNLDFKALVMAYMSNGNLERWLYSANFSLNILKRFGIMIDVASALEYLHEGYTVPIVHCDLKPNNILLDEDMVAHVGDFGIAKLLTVEQRMQQTRTFGTIGYMAPEYGSDGLVSTMVDVYSFGILLMEIFLRRKPTDEMFSGELTMRKWVSESFPNSVMQIVDHELLNMTDESNRARHESCLISTIGVALECTKDLPEERPNMKNVLVRIKKIEGELVKPLLAEATT